MNLPHHLPLQVDCATLGGMAPTVSQTTVDAWTHVLLTFDLPRTVQQDDWRVCLSPTFTPTFRWAPHLAPEPDDVIDQHVFRAPVLIAADGDQVAWLIPDLDLIGAGPVRTYLDVDAPANRWTLGLSHTGVHGHVFFHREPGAVHEGRIEVGFYLASSHTPTDVRNPFRRPLAFLWARFGHALAQSDEPIGKSLKPFVDHTYAWAFERWPAVWQEFKIGDKRVGAPAFIVNPTQSPNFSGPVGEYEFRSIWNQCWFSSLRSACGLYRYARRFQRPDLMERANLTKELALAMVRPDGLFYSAAATRMRTIEEDSGRYSRSEGWQTLYLGNSNRGPGGWEAVETAPFHIPDMSWTACRMLEWYRELEPDPRLLDAASHLADRLATLQDSDGHFPSWLDSETLSPLVQLRQSPQSALTCLLFLTLHQLKPNQTRVDMALKGLESVWRLAQIGQWEDFETYWSCNPWGRESVLGRQVPRNGQFKQNTMSMFWTAEAFLVAYETTGQDVWLQRGTRVLDEMLMYQAVWQPPFMYVPVFGGFGVMNADGEWNDSRQSLFAEIIARYGATVNHPEYTERARSALRAAFSMIFAPENPESFHRWLAVYPFFDTDDYGFMMENYGHGGRTTPEGEGIGDFTIYDWGNGAAAEAWNRMLDHEWQVD